MVALGRVDGRLDGWDVNYYALALSGYREYGSRLICVYSLSGVPKRTIGRAWAYLPRQLERLAFALRAESREYIFRMSREAFLPLGLVPSRKTDVPTGRTAPRLISQEGHPSRETDKRLVRRSSASKMDVHPAWGHILRHMNRLATILCVSRLRYWCGPVLCPVVKLCQIPTRNTLLNPLTMYRCYCTTI